MRSILLHIYDDEGLESRLQAAFDLARLFAGHITCLHAIPFEDYLVADPLVVAELPEDFSEKMRKRRLGLQARTEERLRSEGVNWDWIHVDEMMSTSLVRWSVLADVIVLSIADRAVTRDDARPLAAKVATRAIAPVLAVPASFGRLQLETPVLVAWNGSPEAAVAMRAAMPLLQSAREVCLLEVEQDTSHYPRDLAARYLARHGVKTQLMQHRPIDDSVSGAISTVAEELGSGLIVMGAYSHSRLKEALLGGVTRDLVATSAIPLLLAH